MTKPPKSLSPASGRHVLCSPSFFSSTSGFAGVSEVLAVPDCAGRVEGEETVTAITANITSGSPIDFDFMRRHPFCLERPDGSTPIGRWHAGKEALTGQLLRSRVTGH